MEIKFNEQINADSLTIYAAASTEKGIQGWWCQNSEVAEDVKGDITLNFVKDGKPIVMKFSVEELVPNKKVVWSCNDNANPAWIGTKLTFEIDERGNFSFIHGNFDEKWRGLPAFDMTAEGWKYFMGSFKSYCETGVGQPW